MKRLLSTILFLASALPLGAQILSAPSVNPSADSAFFATMRARSDSIRRTESRPVVGLALSGGGAKGAAHVGVLRYLEEEGIPIDMITGTSMGGLVGGLYSLGYKASTLDSLIRGIDWNNALSDNVPRRFISYEDIQRGERFILDMPFHYREETYREKMSEGIGYARRKQGVHLSSTEGEKASRTEDMKLLASSLPSGYVFGLNVNNIFGTLSVGYQDSLDFMRLPIPFMCVSTDIVSGNSKNWHSGPIQAALRATMAIPAMFEPVRYQDMVLIDGGTRNNFPVDLARAMGADIVIGVNLNQGSSAYEDVNNIGEMVSQIISMLGKDAYVVNILDPDVTIHPELPEYGMLSFSTEAIDTIIGRGYAAAQVQAGAIAGIKSRLNGAKPRLNAPPAIDIGRNPVVLSDVEFLGVDGTDADYLKNKIRFSPGDSLSAQSLRDATGIIFATGVFESVNYTVLEQPDGRFLLRFHCRKGPNHALRLGVRGDTEELVAAVVNVGLNTRSLHGSQLELEGRAGSRWHLMAHYSIANPFLVKLNVDAGIGGTSAEMIRDGVIYSGKYFRTLQSLYVSGLRSSVFDIQLGLKRETFRLNRWASASGKPVTGSDGIIYNSRYVSAFADARAYTLDDKYYPSRGFTLGARYERYLTDQPVRAVSADFRGVIRLDDGIALIPSMWARGVQMGERVFPLYNFAGGDMAGRYLPQQIPFAPCHRFTQLDDYAVVLGLDFRANIYKNTYLSLQGGYIKDAPEILGVFNKPLQPSHYGVALELAYNSIIGPVKLTGQWCDFSGYGAYLGVGFDF